MSETRYVITKIEKCPEWIVANNEAFGVPHSQCVNCNGTREIRTEIKLEIRDDGALFLSPKELMTVKNTFTAIHL